MVIYYQDMDTPTTNSTGKKTLAVPAGFEFQAVASAPMKSKSSYGNWVVYVQATTKKSEHAIEIPVFFWRKADAVNAIAFALTSRAGHVTK